MKFALNTNKGLFCELLSSLFAAKSNHRLNLLITVKIITDRTVLVIFSSSIEGWKDESIILRLHWRVYLLIVVNWNHFFHYSDSTETLTLGPVHALFSYFIEKYPKYRQCVLHNLTVQVSKVEFILVGSGYIMLTFSLLTMPCRHC